MYNIETHSKKFTIYVYCTCINAVTNQKAKITYKKIFAKQCVKTSSSCELTFLTVPACVAGGTHTVVIHTAATVQTLRGVSTALPHYFTTVT